jgi:hypothetical protein
VLGALYGPLSQRAEISVDGARGVSDPVQQALRLGDLGARVAGPDDRVPSVS